MYNYFRLKGDSMRKIVEIQDVPTPQVLYNNINEFIEDLESDTYTLEPLFILLGQVRAFLEENYEIE